MNLKRKGMVIRMKDKTLKQANDIKESLKAIEKLRYILRVPYPTIHDGSTDISLVCFDVTTRALIKKVISETLDKREDELKEEFKNL